MRFACLNSRTASALLAAMLLAGCQSVYYKTMEKFGYEKRDILVDRVDDAREAQQEAKKQFESALAQFIAVTNFSGGELERQYNKLKDEFEIWGIFLKQWTGSLQGMERRAVAVQQRRTAAFQSGPTECNTVALPGADRCHEARREKAGSGPRRIS